MTDTTPTDRSADAAPASEPAPDAPPSSEPAPADPPPQPGATAEPPTPEDVAVAPPAPDDTARAPDAPPPDAVPAPAAPQATTADPASDQPRVRREITAVVTSSKSDKTIIVRVDRRIRHPVYGKFIRRSTKLAAHDERNACREGDTVTVVETRPRSKTKSWTLGRIVARGA